MYELPVAKKSRVDGVLDNEVSLCYTVTQYVKRRNTTDG